MAYLPVSNGSRIKDIHLISTCISSKSLFTVVPGQPLVWQHRSSRMMTKQQLEGYLFASSSEWQDMHICVRELPLLMGYSFNLAGALGVWNELWNEWAGECGCNAFLHPGTEATTYYKPTAYDTNPVVRAHVTALISSTLLLPSFEETNYCQLTSTSRVENKTHSSGVELHHWRELLIMAGSSRVPVSLRNFASAKTAAVRKSPHLVFNLDLFVTPFLQRL